MSCQKVIVMTKNQIIERIQSALADVKEIDPLKDVPSNWIYGQAQNKSRVVERFVERLEDYKASVRCCLQAEEIPSLIADILADCKAQSLVVPPGLNPDWYGSVPKETQVYVDYPPLDKLALNAISAVLTAARVGFAETGTICLVHSAEQDSDQGRRIISLLPDIHICVLSTDQIVTDVPDGLAQHSAAIRAAKPITWISGPSATSDIELSRVEGVHGPRNLYVILVG
jgi:L-lactate dehydrogenase complex protein LldG